MEDVVAQQAAEAGGMGLMSLVFSGLLTLLFVASYWKIFAKAGQPGWASIIPFYNFYVMNKIGGRGPLFLLGLLVPFVNVAVFVMIVHGVSKAFGKGALYTLGIFLAAPVFVPLLAFGAAEYRGGAPKNSVRPPVPKERSLSKAA
jgi:hypothetical protein